MSYQKEGSSEFFAPSPPQVVRGKKQKEKSRKKRKVKRMNKENNQTKCEFESRKKDANWMNIRNKKRDLNKAK